MSLASLARAFGVVALLAAARPAAALPKLTLQPVELLGYAADDSLRLGVELPCGSRFYGIVAAVEPRSGRMRLAAAVVEDGFVCTAMPEPSEVRVPYLATTRFKTIEPMKVDEGTRLAVARISDIRRAGAKLTAVYEPRCGRDVGTLIHPAGGRLELAFVERQPHGAPPACAPRATTRQITAVDLTSRVRLAPLTEKPKSLQRAFSLRLAEVRPESLVRLPGGGARVAYRRACNEAPVGLVLGQPRRGQASVGVLVARYFNFPCSAAPSWTTLAETDLTLPGEVAPVALAATADGDERLALRLPTRLVRGEDEDLSLGYLGGCDEAWGVYSHDERGALAVGVLVRGECKKAGGEVSLSQPFIATRVPAGALYPLKLKGAAR